MAEAKQFNGKRKLLVRKNRFIKKEEEVGKKR